MDLMKLMDEFGTEQACREVLAELRWPEGVTCPRCEGKRQAFDSDRYVWDCYSCGYQFSALSGTVLHDTKLPLRKWFVAVFLMVEAKKGISANQMKRTLGVSYKTAWYLCHRIRAAMAVEYAQLTGTVEMDETYIGGKKRAPKREDGRSGLPRGYNPRADKIMVLGAVSRDGQIRMAVEKRANRKTVGKFIASHIADDAPFIYTDGAHVYQHLGDHDTVHESVDHQKDEWVRGDVHTNSVESAWSLLKRSIVGSYHQLSAKHLPAYLDEMEWRFNNRGNEYLFRDTLIQLVTAEALPYQELTA
ncbi:MAG: IS1595 family transposase [Dehalococcoidia bacterium]